MASVAKELLLELLEIAELFLYGPPDFFLTPGQRRRKHELLRKRRRALYDLDRKGYVTHEGRGKTAKYSLTEKGKLRAQTAKLEALTLPREPRWDGKWRLVMFDIPEKKKAARDSLRQKFRALGMKQVQKSVFAYPFECKDAMDLVIEVFDVAPYIRYAVTSRLAHDRDLRHFFEV